ncbi:MAG: urea amidolyase associated protein UAAP2 [Burkholderiales bacterium]
MLATVESALKPADAVLDEVCLAGDPWAKVLKQGQILRIVDLEGNQAVDTIFYSAADVGERYSLTHTIQAQGALYLTVGSVLMSSEARPMLTITADTCGRHDTLGGACSCESNTVRYALEKRTMHSCRDSFMLALARIDAGSEAASGVPHLTKRDVVSNINFFMNVPVTPEGKLTFEDGISAPGKYVEMRAEMDVVVLVSNCPQLNNPCNGYNPTPVRFLVWDPA